MQVTTAKDVTSSFGISSTELHCLSPVGVSTPAARYGVGALQCVYEVVHHSLEVPLLQYSLQWQPIHNIPCPLTM